MMTTNDRNGGDLRLCYVLRNFSMVLFLRTLEEVIPELELVDQAVKHDDVLPPEILAALSKCDSALVLRSAERELESALEKLRLAYEQVEGLFRGSLKDETEESILRLTKLLEARLQGFGNVVNGYQKPQRPYEIRRETISRLISECNDQIARFVSRVSEELPSDASGDLLAELVLCRQELERMPDRLKQLREKSSQKMAAHVHQFWQDMIRLHMRLVAVECQARERSGAVVLHDPRVRDWSLSLSSAAA
ncbi:MAG: hypothetical protein K2W82_17175 [Candidatus Obscuribacterales bacterium]|nr:hypothetical protein [Candidatus Obscuribacterales bacterium]